MRKSITFGLICFALAFSIVGNAFAKTGDISMGMFSIPLPADGKNACQVWLDRQSNPGLTCDDFFASLKGDAGDDACYPVYSYTGWGTSSFQLNIKWCCDSGAVDCQEMTDSYPVTNAYTSYYNSWVAQYCSVVFETESIENGYQVTAKNPCTGETETYDITGEVGASANITNVSAQYTPYPQSTNSGANPDKQGYMTLTITYVSGSDSVHITTDSCETHIKQYNSGEHEGEYYNVKVCHDAQGASVAGVQPVYAKGGNYEFAYDAPSGMLGLADVANKIPLTTEDKYKGPDISNRKIGYKYVLETYPDGTTVETSKEFDQPEEVVEYVNNSGVITTNTGKRYTCGGKDTSTVCMNSGAKYCFELLGGATGAVCDNAISVGAALDNEFNGTTGEYLYHGPNVSAGIKGYLYKVLTHGSGRVEEVDQKEDECDPVIGTTSAADQTLKTGQRCKCGGMTSAAPCNVANGTYLLGVHDGAQDLLAVMQNQVQVKIKMFGTTLYYCSGSATCCDTNQTPGEGDFATCWTSVNIAGLHGDNGASCLATKSGTDWYICCSPSYAGNDCTKVDDPAIIAMLNGMMCQVNYEHKYLHDDGAGNVTANTTKAGAKGERIIVTNTCNSDSENLDAYYGEDGEPGGDYNPCDGLEAGSAAALSRVHHTTSVYVPHDENGTSGTTTGIGYYTETNVMCDTTGNKIVRKYDKCEPVSLATGDSRTVGTLTCGANQAILTCTPQEAPTTPYNVCSDTEASGYPKVEYIAPTVSSGKFTEKGYANLVHKYVGTNTEVIMRDKPDTCHSVFKQEHSRNASTDTVTTTMQSVLKCQIQSYDRLGSGVTGTWTSGNWYCLNTTNNIATSCDGYSESISEDITSELKYHLPIMDGTTPIGAGWTYREEKSGSISVREARVEKDDCKQYLTRTISGNVTTTASVWKCTVSAPGNSGAGYAEGREYCLGYTGGTCPASLIDIGAAVDDAAEGDPCAGSTSATAVKKVESRTYSRTTNSQGSMVSTYKMCDDSTHTESTADECKEVPTPAGQTCTNGVWMRCTRQADEGTGTSTARGTTYGYCAVYPQCVGNESSTSIVKKTQRSYTAPTKTGSNSYYDTVGKITDSKISCGGAVLSTEEETEDQCEEVADDAIPVCPSTATVRKKCKRQGKESDSLGVNTEYTLCTAGPSIYGSIANNDPCGGDTTSDAAKKKVKSIQYEYIAKDATGNAAKVGYSKKTTTMCNPAGNTDEYIYDTCVPDVAAAGCNGSSDKNYKCYNQSKLYSANASEREYNTCNPSSNVSSVALSNKIDGKLDNDVTFTTGTYNNKDYILMSASGITNKPVVPVDDLKPQSLFDTWKEEQIQFVEDNNWDNAQCMAMYGDNCNKLNEALTTAMMFQSFTDYGRWKQEQVENNVTSTENLTETAYRSGLICPGGITISLDASNSSGNTYKMTCADTPAQ